MKRWAIYAGISALLVGLSALIVGFWLEGHIRMGVWVGLGVAWLVQLAAFAILIAATRKRPALVVVGWTAGTFLRLGALALMAWLSLAKVWGLPAAPTLLALVSGLFVLLLLEPLVFRRGMEVT